MTTTGFWGLQTPISIWTCLEVKSRFMMEANVQVRRTNSRYDIMDPSPYWYSSSIQSTLLHKCTWKLKYIGNIPKANTFEGTRGVHLNHILKEKVGQRKAQRGLGMLRENERKNIAKKIVLVLLLYNMSSKIVYWSRCFQSVDRSLVKISQKMAFKAEMHCWSWRKRPEYEQDGLHPIEWPNLDSTNYKFWPWQARIPLELLDAGLPRVLV